MNGANADTNAYLAAQPEDARVALESLRHTIKAIAPGAEESFAYGLPAFRYRGRPLAYFGATPNHCALYGLNAAAHGDAFAAYDTSKGTIRFQPDVPLPESLVRMLIGARIAEIDAASTRRRQK